MQHLCCRNLNNAGNIQGLYMIPDLRRRGDTTLFYSRSVVGEQLRNEYIREIDEYLTSIVGFCSESTL